MPSSAFDANACLAALGAEAGVFHLNAIAECDSTNTQLMRLAESGAPAGTVVVADNQTAGRGRRARVWISSPQHSLTFSLLWRFPPASSAPQALSLVVGLALHDALATLGVISALKWPNDILCEGRKLAGVLIETQPGDLKSVVIGIGFNRSLPPEMPVEIARSAIGLDDIMSRVPTREALLALLLMHLAALFERYTTQGFADLRDEWQTLNAFRDRDVSISGGQSISGICRGVSESGELLINTPDGIRRVITGDVSLSAA